MDFLNNILNFNAFGHDFEKYFYTLGLFIVLYYAFKLAFYLTRKYLSKLAEKTETDWDDILLEIFSTIKPPLYLYLAFYLSVKNLDLSEFVDGTLNTILWIWVVVIAISMAQKFISHLINKFIVKEEDSQSQNAAGIILIITKILFWSLGLLLILSNLGFNITSLIAGLGIGGVAVAFALQNILSDLFSSFAIYFDKPFQVGDFIVIGDQAGVVKKIGIKTTRIKALQGEELVMSNNHLTSATIQNFKKLENRRVGFDLGVTYDTPQASLKKIPDFIKEIIKEDKNATFDRAHFKEFGDSALVFEIIYFAETADYNVFMNIHQNILFKIREKFISENIEFAFPTQTVYLNK